MFILYSGLLTAVFVLDDLFMFHEFVFPIYLHIREKAVFLLYIVLTASYFWAFQNEIRRAEYPILILAGGFFTISMGIDVVTSRLEDSLLPTSGMDYLVEDGAKLLGIVTWCIFFTRTALMKPAVPGTCTTK